MSYSKGIFWLDDCRIPFVDEGDEWCIDHSKEKILNNPQPMGKQEDLLRRNHLDKSNQQGRFTPNLLVSDNMLNDGGKGTNSRYYDLDLWFDKMVEGL